MTQAIPPNLSISVSRPLWDSDEFLFQLTGVNDSYSHTLNALGGYWDASILIKQGQNSIEDWVADGLGRHIEVYNESQVLIFEGFVNRIVAQLGPLSVVRGPLLDIANRVSLIYSTIDTSVTPPILGIRAVTATANDTTSQGKYGVLQKVLSSGGVTPTQASQIRDVYISEYKDPQTGQSVVLPSAQSVQVNLEIKGYIHLTNSYAYTSATTGLENLSTKLTNIFAAAPTVTFGTGNIDSNTTQVGAYEAQQRVAWGLVKGLVSQGDSSDNRYVMGVYNGRKVFYNQAPTAGFYQQRVSDPEIRIETFGDGEFVFPWNVVPAKWLFISDFLTGRITESDIRKDPRYIFIERLTYTAPWGLRIDGGKVDNLPQRLARLGISGVGA